MGKRNAIKRKYYKTRAAVEWEAHRNLRDRVVAIRPSLNTSNSCSLPAGNSGDFCSSLQTFMHSRKRMQDDVIVLNDEQGVIRDRNQVAQSVPTIFFHW